jgi:hypothetical protein
MYYSLLLTAMTSYQMQTRLWGHNLESDPTQMWFLCAITAVLDDNAGGRGAGYLGRCLTRLQVGSGRRGFNSSQGQRLFPV